MDGLARARYLSRPQPRQVGQLLERIFTWWSGATFGTLNIIRKRAKLVGEDAFGNRYFEATKIIDGDAGRRRRYVTYKGYADASKVPAEWHGWLHHTFDDCPATTPLKRRAWEKDHQPNLTGTAYAYRPSGSILKSGERPHATGDYQAWTPE